MKTILVPTDFSKNATVAFQYAIGLAKKTKAKIILLHVFETTVLYTEIPMSTVQMDYTMLHDTAARNLKRYYHKFKSEIGKLNVELMLSQGLPSAMAVQVAQERKVDLMVIGTTGKGLAGRLFIGSNAVRLIRNSSCLVLAIPPKGKFEEIKTIVYTTDLTNESVIHAKSILPFAKELNAELIFLHVNSLFERPEIKSDAAKLSKKIKKLISYPKTSGYVCNDEDVSIGINNFIKNHKADCIAMYTHHRSILGSLFNKSITKTMSFHTKVPLLVIHEKDLIAQE